MRLRPPTVVAVWGTVFLALALASSPARGDSPNEADGAAHAAREHYERGTTHYNLGRFEEAVAEYRKAYELKADAVFLFNIAQAYRQLGHDDKALFFYRRFRSTAPDSPYGAQVDTIIADLEARLEPAAGGPVTGAATDGAPVPTAPADRPTESSLVTESEVETAARQPTVWKNPWLWAGVGAVVLTGALVAIVVLGDGDDAPETQLGGYRAF